MADKRISQLVERTDIANNDVVPIVAFGATTTNKATISSIQEFMQENLDLGVTSVGITLGTTGTDVNVTGSPITTSGNITINIPTASATNRGLLSSADWSTFNSKQQAITLTTTGTSGASTLVGGTLNIPNYSTDLSGYVTLGTAQTITAQKTFNTSGSSDSVIITHGSGSGIALDVIKAGNSEAIRVTKTSGSGNAMTISGGNFEAGTIVKTGGTSSQFLKADGSVDSNTYLTTASASAAYVPYTGANSNLDLGQFDLLADTIIVNGSSPTSGSYLGFKHATTVTTGAEGFTSMYTFGTNIIGYKSVSGATNKDFSFDMSGITANVSGGRVYTLPDASGTLALTSNLSAYLPLTGGTLTGALNGTSATFSSSVTAGAELLISAQNFSTTATNNGIRLKDLDVAISNEQVISKIEFETSTSVSPGVTAKIDALSNTFSSSTSNGNLRFFTSTSSTALTERMRITSTGAVGIGTDSPVTTFQINSTIDTTGYTTSQLLSGTENIKLYQIQNVNTSVDNNGESGILLGQNLNNVAQWGISVKRTGSFVGDLIFRTRTASATSAERMRITSSGNLGIGTASPSEVLHIFKSTFPIFKIQSTSYNSSLGINTTSGTLVLNNESNAALGFNTNNTEQMRITSGGDILFGTQTLSTTHAYFDSASSDRMVLNLGSSTTSNANLIAFNNPNGNVGTIATNGSLTLYNTTSDYRLKEDLKEIVGLEKVLALKVYDYKWKSDESRMDGVLAHELAEVLPYAVSGEKDELNEDGTDKMQAVDYSKIVPVLIKAIQELKTEIDSLKNQIK
jgi:hypothetical protein